MKTGAFRDKKTKDMEVLEQEKWWKDQEGNEIKDKTKRGRTVNEIWGSWTNEKSSVNSLASPLPIAQTDYSVMSPPSIVGAVAATACPGYSCQQPSWKGWRLAPPRLSARDRDSCQCSQSWNCQMEISLTWQIHQTFATMNLMITLVEFHFLVCEQRETRTDIESHLSIQVSLQFTSGLDTSSPSFYTWFFKETLSQLEKKPIMYQTWYPMLLKILSQSDWMIALGGHYTHSSSYRWADGGSEEVPWLSQEHRTIE